MQPYTKLELSVGAFVLCGVAALAYLSLTLGDLSLTPSARYTIKARFASVAGLKTGDPVRLAGVTVGAVGGLSLVDYVAEAELEIDASVHLPKDTIASIQSAGLLGDAFVALSPGAEEQDLQAGESIVRTEPAISLTDLIAKYAFGGGVEDDRGDNSPESTRSEAAEDDDRHDDKPSPFDDPLE